MQVAGLRDFLVESDYCGVVMLKRGDDTVFASAHGLASPRWGVPNTLTTRFDTASITKLFTSVGVLQLVGRGQLDLDASIHQYVDLDGTTISGAVTLRHLLTHTSGIADDADEEAGEEYSDLWVDRPVYAVTEAVHFLPQFAHKQPLALPGVQCRYCNVGYVLAGMAVERASGRSYRAYVTEEVFAPAGMGASGFFDRRHADPDVAEGFDPGPDGRLEQNIFKSPPIGTPDGGARVTAPDLLQFVAALRGGRLLTPALTTAYLTPQVPHDDEVDYGFGLQFKGPDWWKEGCYDGASGVVTHYGAHGIDAVVLSNTRDGAWPVVAELDRLAEAV
ncbi:Penicillin-binding protein, beta-lactamase class C [metagenome]|uniref:Penicillin-binding protein, beta-lactamase class C n=1 Tax=metagenome TaxID=256318 RepID=A0A2P2C0X9_9ZZZZ